MDSWDLVRQMSSRGQSNELGNLLDSEGRLEMAYRVLNWTTKFEGDESQR